MRSDVARNALLATHGGLSLELCAVIGHISPMALYRLVCALGRQSLVTALPRCGLALPAYFLADEKHSRCLTEMCQTQPIKMPWCPLRLLRQMLSNLRGRFKRENEMDVHLFSRDHDFADQALGDGLLFFKRELFQVLTEQLAKGRRIVDHLLPMDTLLSRLC